MDHGNHMDMPSMNMNMTNTTSSSHHKMMMHMTFYWGKNALVLFSGWPGTGNAGMYVLALFVVFFLSVFVEFLSHSQIIKSGSSDLSAGVIQTFMHALRMGLAYMVMLAVMSFNGGIFLVAIAGHTLGFFLFGSRIFKKTSATKTSDLPPMSC